MLVVMVVQVSEMWACADLLWNLGLGLWGFATMTQAEGEGGTVEWSLG